MDNIDKELEKFDRITSIELSKDLSKSSNNEVNNDDIPFKELMRELNAAMQHLNTKGLDEEGLKIVEGATGLLLNASMKINGSMTYTLKNKQQEPVGIVLAFGLHKDDQTPEKMADLKILTEGVQKAINDAGFGT